jgi:hypothetical protein
MKPVVIVAGVGPGITAAPLIVDLADAAATRSAVEQVRTWAGGDPSSLVYNACALRKRRSSMAWLMTGPRL